MAQTASHFHRRMRSCMGVKGLLCLVLVWLVSTWSMVTMDVNPDMGYGMNTMAAHVMKPSPQPHQPNAAHAAHASSNPAACCMAGGMLSCLMGLPVMEQVLPARGRALPCARAETQFESVVHRPPLRPPQILLFA